MYTCEPIDLVVHVFAWERNGERERNVVGVKSASVPAVVIAATVDVKEFFFKWITKLVDLVLCCGQT